MRKFCTILLLTVLAILLTGISAQQPRKNSIRGEIDAALQNGKTVVLAVAPTPHRNTGDDEAYGDWASYLEAFTSHAGPDIKILKVTPTAVSQLLSEPRLAETYATLFLRDRDHALVYDGMALEPGVYSAGLAYLANKRDTKLETGYGLKEKAARFR
jgi:hypothetical protein